MANSYYDYGRITGTATTNIDSFESYADNSDLFNTWTATSTSNAGDDDWFISSNFTVDGSQTASTYYNNGNPIAQAMPGDGLNGSCDRNLKNIVDFRFDRLNQTNVRLYFFLQSINGNGYIFEGGDLDNPTFSVIGETGSDSLGSNPLSANTHYRAIVTGDNSSTTLEVRDIDANTSEFTLTVNHGAYTGGGVGMGMRNEEFSGPNTSYQMDFDYFRTK